MRLLCKVGRTLCAPAAVLIFLVPAAAARADVSFVKAFGSGVSTGVRQFETCTTSCQVGLAWGDAGALTYVEGAAVSSSTGNLLFGNFDSNRVDVFTSSGSFVQGFGGGAAGGTGLETCTTTRFRLLRRRRRRASRSPGAWPSTTRATSSWPRTATAGCRSSRNPGRSSAPSGGASARERTHSRSARRRVTRVSPDPAPVSSTGRAASRSTVPVTCSSSTSANNRVQEFTLAGAYVRTLGATGTGAGQMRKSGRDRRQPRTGNVFVSDSTNSRVNVYSPTGAFVRAFGWGVNTGSAALETCTASCRAGTGGSGSRAVALPGRARGGLGRQDRRLDNFNGRVNVYTEAGGFVRSIGSYGTGAGQIGGAAGPAVDSAGGFIVADTE